MADKLRNPAYTPDCESNLIGWVGRNCGEVLEISGRSDEDWCKEGAGDGLEEYVEDRIICCRESAEVEVKVWRGEPAWKWNKCWGVRGLRVC